MKHIFKFLLPIILLLFYYSGRADGQGMAMDMHDHDGVYLKMMNTMMDAMSKAPQGKTASKDFLYQMIPHHEGAIDMAQYEIMHGKNFTIIQLAKSINQEQQNEIQQMKLWLGQGDVENDKVNDAYRKEMNATMDTMMDDMPGDKGAVDIDRSFAQVMIPHHQAAIDMARVLLKYSSAKTIRSYAIQLIADEQVEIEQMKNFLK
jgi:uncharacterized protein (DUF305 family)